MGLNWDELDLFLIDLHLTKFEKFYRLIRNGSDFLRINFFPKLENSSHFGIFFQTIPNQSEKRFKCRLMQIG